MRVFGLTVSLPRSRNRSRDSRNPPEDGKPFHNHVHHKKVQYGQQNQPVDFKRRVVEDNNRLLLNQRKAQSRQNAVNSCGDHNQYSGRLENSNNNCCTRSSSPRSGGQGSTSPGSTRESEAFMTRSNLDSGMWSISSNNSDTETFQSNLS